MNKYIQVTQYTYNQLTLAEGRVTSWEGWGGGGDEAFPLPLDPVAPPHQTQLLLWMQK